MIGKSKYLEFGLDFFAAVCFKDEFQSISVM